MPLSEANDAIHTLAAPVARHIVVGWLLVHRLHPTLQQAVEKGRVLMLEHLQRHFPEFHWRMPVVRRLDSPRADSEEPVLLLDEGVHERDIQQWDFALVVTQVNMRSYYKPYALAVLLQGHIETQHYPVFAAFVASLGLVIGALAASFELPAYFRHITYVDEET